jgi:hypothetical protein
MVCLAAMIAGCSSIHEDDPVPAQSISFDACKPGKPPADFKIALTGGGPAPVWCVREDSQSPEHHNILFQESADDTSYRFPMCIYDKAIARDVAVEVKYKAISGSVDQAGGIVLRYHPENYYIARANALEDNIDLFKTVNGKRIKIDEVPMKVTPGQWHTLRFAVKGSHLKVTFDGKTAINADDNTFTSPGKVGLWTKADSVSAFKDLQIEPE